MLCHAMLVLYFKGEWWTYVTHSKPRSLAYEETANVPVNVTDTVLHVHSVGETKHWG